MNSYMISYDLIKRKDYPELWDALKSYSTHWHCLGSTWIIKSDSTASQILDALKVHIDDDDKLIVNLLMRVAAWTDSFDEECSSWIQNNL